MKPQARQKKSPLVDSSKALTLEDKFRIQKAEKQKELDLLLDKINAKGLDNLSSKEKARIKKLSQ